MPNEPDALVATDDLRLQALADYRILDTDPERDFDDIVRLASTICHTPVALISFVEIDRQWFKARIGFEACQTPINQSVCRHALGQTELLIIPDLTLDVRTRDNTLVTEDPLIRFYAGAPLVTPDGVVIGTLCVIDTVPRPDGLTPEQAVALEALGRQVIAQLELRKAVARSDVQSVAHKADLDRARFAEEAGGIGTFELDVASGMMAVSPQYCRLFGIPVTDFYHASVSERLIVAEDAEVHSTDRTRRDGSADADVEYRVRRADDGEVRWLARRARFHRDETGRPITMFGTVHDVTDRHQRQFQQESLLRLGDALRDAGSTREVATLAGHALGEVLKVDRAGYGRIEHAFKHLIVEADWSGNGLASIVGTHSLHGLSVTLERLSAGETLTLANIPAAHWLA
ncbi:MAG: PAS domain S-box protein, partial [Hyphomicrobiales bacterium]